MAVEFKALLFIEQPGGSIVSTTTGEEVVRVNVEGMLTEEAALVTRCILVSLEQAFAREAE